MDQADRAALEIKSNYYRRIEGEERPHGSPPAEANRTMPPGAPLEVEAEALFTVDFQDFPIGRFERLESIRLNWVKPDWFKFIPPSVEPFRFVRANGEVITPRHMFTDGGSIPRFAQAHSSLSPWGYAPAYLIHDWEFDAHHAGLSDKSFEAVRDTMMEGLHTLLSNGITEMSWGVFNTIYLAINSWKAREIWGRTNALSPLPSTLVS